MEKEIGKIIDGKLIIEKGITKIEKSAFVRNKEIEQVIIPEGVTHIGEYAFFHCDNLKTVSLPDTIIEIEKEAFSECRELETISCPIGLEKVGKDVFKNCEKLNGWRNGACEILVKMCSYEEIFNHANSKKESCIIDKLPYTYIGKYSGWLPEFECQGHTIEFERYKGLTLLAYDKKIYPLMRYDTIENWIYFDSTRDYYFANIKSLHIEQSTEGLILQIIYNVKHQFEPMGDDAHWTLIGVDVEKKTLIIHENGVIEDISTESKDEIIYSHDGEILFYVPPKIECFQIPKAVKHIGPSAFFNCSKLKSIELHEGLESIGACAFQNCIELQFIVIPKTVKKIEEGAFDGCERLKSFICLGETELLHMEKILSGTPLEELRIAECIMNVNLNEFNGFSNLKYVTLPNNLKRLALHSFWGCNNLTELILPKQLTSISGFGMIENTPWIRNMKQPIIIGDTLYKYAGKDECYRIPDHIVRIAESAFEKCETLQHVQIPESVKRIDEAAFCKCSNLKTVDFPTHDEIVISPNAFDETPWLENYPEDFICHKNYLWRYKGKDSKVIVPSGVKRIGIVVSEAAKLWYNNTLITHVIIPEGVTCLEENAFANCINLEYLELPNSLESIGPCAFYNSKLKEIKTSNPKIQIEKTREWYKPVIFRD